MIVQKNINYVPTNLIYKSLIVESLLEEFNTTSKITLVLNHALEMPWGLMNYNSWLNFWEDVAELLKSRRPNWKIYFLANSYCWPKTLPLHSSVFDDILLVDYYLYRCYKQIIINNKVPHAYRWPSHQQKFLFLTGEPTKPNRSRLLYKFSQHDLLQHSLWSYPDWLSKKDSDFVFLEVAKTLPEFKVDSELKDFCLSHANTPDKDFLPTLLNQSQLENTQKYIAGPQYDHIWTTSSDWGLYYKVFLYTDTLFSVISESHFKDTETPSITEKTWKAIINNHPFIIAGDTLILQALRQQGFITFENFLKIPDYDKIQDPEERLNAVVENTQYWVQNIDKHKYDINLRVQHNTLTLYKVYQDLIYTINNFIQRNNLPISADDLVDINLSVPYLNISHETELEIGQNQHFVNFYNSIKDHNWPVCNSENDYQSLPDHIKDELINTFGYVPKL